MRLYATISLALTTWLLTSCHHKDDLMSLPLPYAAYTDVSYGTDSFQKMDIYLPPGRSSLHTPLILLLHGGGWIAGDKSGAFLFYEINALTNRGYAVANINYRNALENSNKYPVQLYDIGGAITFLADRQESFAINCSKIALFGRSAGAHLAMLYAYTYNSQQRIRAVMDFFGPTDLTDPAIREISLKQETAELLGVPYDLDEQLWYNASPLYHTEFAVPTYIFQGSDDLTVLPEQSQRLKDSLQKRNIPCYYEEEQGIGHGLDSAGWMQHINVALPFIGRFMF